MTSKNKNGTYRAVSTLIGYISALKFWYDEKKAVFSLDELDLMDKFVLGYKKTVAEHKKNGTMKKQEGKEPVTFEKYAKLCKKALFAVVSRVKLSCLVHCFMVMCWNLFARSCSVSDLQYHHFSWEGDALVCDMGKHKGDQTGEKSQPKHIFANPYEPAICPILSLGLHVFSSAFRPEGSGEAKHKIFAGRPYDIFSSWLLDAVVSLLEPGQDGSEIGSHSFRKGVATFVASYLGGPSIVAIFLRAGWSLGQVQKRYLTRADGSDNLCGRVACGLNLNDGASFSVLPPHFHPSFVLTAEQWAEIAPGYDQLPACFQGCLIYLLASIVHHYDWLTAKDESGSYVNLPASHPFFVSRIFTSGKLLQFRQHLLPLNTDGRCEESGMTATGIPPSVENARRLARIEAENVKLRAEIVQLRTDMITLLPEAVVGLLKENITAPGLHQVTRTEMITMIEEGFARLRSSMAAVEPAQTVTTITTSATVVEGQLNNWKWNTYNVWSWGGKLDRPVPMDFEFPKTKCAVKEICDMFFSGIPAQNIRPFHFIKSMQLKRDQQSAFCKAMTVFRTISERAATIGSEQFGTTSVAELYKVRLTTWDQLFTQAFLTLLDDIKACRNGKVVHNPGEMSYSTFYDLLGVMSKKGSTTLEQTNTDSAE